MIEPMDTVEIPILLLICLLVGFAYLAIVRILERAVLLPKIGFVFSAAFLFLPIIVSIALMGGGAMLVLRAVTSDAGTDVLEMRLLMATVGVGLLYLLTHSTWDQLLDARKAATGSAHIPSSKVGKAIDNLLGHSASMIGIVARAALTLALLGFLIYGFFLAP